MGMGKGKPYHGWEGLNGFSRINGFELSDTRDVLVDSKYSLNQIRNIDLAFTFDRTQDQDAKLSDFPIRGVHEFEQKAGVSGHSRLCCFDPLLLALQLLLILGCPFTQ